MISKIKENYCSVVSDNEIYFAATVFLCKQNVPVKITCAPL
ncbi:MAG: hypothetical protein OJF59_003192 [Cytophagales bacterium]|nr:MAG: hypothetical protein OJF59_003192 [Cytophagales bacterium]